MSLLHFPRDCDNLQRWNPSSETYNCWYNLKRSIWTWIQNAINAIVSRDVFKAKKFMSRTLAKNMDAFFLNTQGLIPVDSCQEEKQSSLNYMPRPFKNLQRESNEEDTIWRWIKFALNITKPYHIQASEQGKELLFWVWNSITPSVPTWFTFKFPSVSFHESNCESNTMATMKKWQSLSRIYFAGNEK